MQNRGCGGLVNLLDSNPPLNHKCEVRPGVLGDECLLHLQEFFRAGASGGKRTEKIVCASFFPSG